MEEHFGSDEMNKEIVGEKIQINDREIKRAMRIMGKKKAPSTDGVLDLIFEPKEW